MNFRLLSASLGSMLLLLAGAMGLCFVVGYLLPPGVGHNPATAINGWEISTALTGLCGLGLRLAGRGASLNNMLAKDALGIVGTGWLVCSLFAALPFYFCEPRLTPARAIFEAVSGLTTTGSTVFATIEPLPRTVILWRSLTQWMGGMGILAMFVLVSAGSGVRGKSLFQTESSMHANEELGARIRATATWLWLLYIGLTVTCGLGLWLLGMSAFQAVNHTMAAVSTGGFGTETSSVNDFSEAIKIWLILFMFLCGISFPLHLAFLRSRKLKTLTKHEELRAYSLIILLVAAGIWVGRMVTMENGFSTWAPLAVETAFTVVSTATSTGFVVGDYDTWPTLAQGGLLFVMVIGGCAGSTAGGLKAARVVLLMKVLRAELQKAFRPNLVVTYWINGRPVPPGISGHLLAVLTSAILAMTLGSYLLLAFEPGLSPTAAITGVISSLSNTGPAFAELGPTQSYAPLHSPSLILLSLLMILGRLEYIALLVLLSSALWRRY